MYSCEQNTKDQQTRYCNKYVYCNTIGFAEIRQIISFRDENDLEINGFIIEKLQSRKNYLQMEHIQEVVRGTIQLLVYDDNVSIVPAIAIDVQGSRIIIAKLPNVWETD